jgi:hypothetical protein
MLYNRLVAGVLGQLQHDGAQGRDSRLALASDTCTEGSAVHLGSLGFSAAKPGASSVSEC